MKHGTSGRTNIDCHSVFHTIVGPKWIRSELPNRGRRASSTGLRSASCHELTVFVSRAINVPLIRYTHLSTMIINATRQMKSWQVVEAILQQTASATVLRLARTPPRPPTIGRSTVIMDQREIEAAPPDSKSGPLAKWQKLVRYNQSESISAS